MLNRRMTSSRESPQVTEGAELGTAGQVETELPHTTSGGRPSLKANSAARLVSDISALGFSLIAATVTARLLGPSGKGYYSTLLLLGGVFVVCFSAGLGEAAIVLTGRRRFSNDTAIPATVLAIGVLSVFSALLFVVVAYLAVGAETANDRTAILIGGVLSTVNVLYNTTAAFLLGQERVVLVAVLAIIAAGLSTAALWVLLAVGDLGAAGALLGGVIGSSVALAATIVYLRRSNVVLRPRWSAAYLRSAFPFGASLQVSNLLVLMTARVDLVFVYRLANPSEAGRYSVALTIGTIVASVPTALSYASFPRLATVGEEEARQLIAQLFRVGIVAALVCGAALAVLTPVAIPLAFGSAFSGAIAPTLLLIPGGILWSGQWILCRASAARGQARPLLVSFLASCVTMVVLDLVLIAPFGGVGAATASLIASAVGLLVSILYYRRWGWDWASMVPRVEDLSALVQEVRRIGLSVAR
jgi:O-antigen/teichoic acid export membrane protein